jgi:uncharacterized protein (DUF58 family)
LSRIQAIVKTQSLSAADRQELYGQTAMKWAKRLEKWLETHWVTPAYAGGLLIALTLFFFLAASNTLSGWLYVISGVSLALLLVAALLPVRSLSGIQIRRIVSYPISAGDLLTLEVEIINSTTQPKALLQVQDLIPSRIGRPPRTVIEQLAPNSTYTWSYSLEPQHRGIYDWQTLYLRTAAPLGLFWCQRSRVAPTRAIVYPRVLPLSHCPLIDQIGQELNLQLHSSYRARAATEGATRSLRPYRWGDPTRLVHWRSSARYGELRVRELETFTGGQEIILCLDTSQNWQPDPFEQAVMAMATLYFYARRNHPDVQLWTANTGKVQGDQTVLETLAGVACNGAGTAHLPHLPLLWLTQDPDSLDSLPLGSRWLLWSGDRSAAPDVQTLEEQTSAQAAGLPSPPMPGSGLVGLTIEPGKPLQFQLQTMPGRGAI